MFNPTSTINPGSDWMLQTVSKQKQKQRAQALNAAGNEHAHVYWGEQNTEAAEFTLGGAYGENDTIAVPSLGSGIIEWRLVYSETEFPKLSVTKNDAAGGGTFALPSTGDGAITLPARTIGVPLSIPGIYSGLVAAKTVEIACSCQHVEETNGSGAYGTIKGMRDAVITVTITGVDGKPTFSGTNAGFASGWGTPSEQEGKSNTAVDSGSIVYEKHFAVAAAA
ncbi:MAG: hypothetical protein IJ983_04830 [Kiritimatiellae bacterium]|nr:hypothetical protein [Kiritimatiellia bacterium]